MIELYEDLKDLNQIHNANCRRLMITRFKFLVPEDICTHPKEGYWKSQEEESQKPN